MINNIDKLEVIKEVYAMKKFLKIMLIIIGAISLIFVALIGIGLFVDVEYDDHIENGRYTYVPEDENNGNEYIEFNMKDNDELDSELTYYNSIEKAILNSPLKEEHEDLSAPKDFLNHVDETLHIWQGKNYDTIFYRAGNDNDDIQGLVMARCKKASTEWAYTICIYKCLTSHNYTSHHLWWRF